MLMETINKKRTRVEVSTSVKGVKTFSCTVELMDGTNEEILAESDALVAELDKRYPATIEATKETKQ